MAVLAAVLIAGLIGAVILLRRQDGAGSSLPTIRSQAVAAPEKTLDLGPNVQPSSIVPTQDGGVWFADRPAGKIGRFIPGSPVKLYAVDVSAFPDIGDVVAGPDGGLYFFSKGKLIRLSADGAATPLSYDHVVGLTRALDGTIWVEQEGVSSLAGSDIESDIVRLAADGSLISRTAISHGTGGRLEGIKTVSLQPGAAEGPDGSLWFLEGLDRAIGVMSRTGSYHHYMLPSEVSERVLFGRLALGSDGAMWFSVPMAALLGRIDNSGHLTTFPILYAAHHLVTAPGGLLVFSEFPWISDYPAPPTHTQDPRLGFLNPQQPRDIPIYRPIGGHEITDLVVGPDGNVWAPQAGFPDGVVTTWAAHGVATQRAGSDVVEKWTSALHGFGLGVLQLDNAPYTTLTDKQRFWARAAGFYSDLKRAIDAFTLAPDTERNRPALDEHLQWAIDIAQRTSMKPSKLELASAVGDAQIAGTDAFAALDYVGSALGLPPSGFGSSRLDAAPHRGPTSPPGLLVQPEDSAQRVTDGAPGVGGHLTDPEGFDAALVAANGTPPDPHQPIREGYKFVNLQVRACHAGIVVPADVSLGLLVDGGSFYDPVVRLDVPADTQGCLSGSVLFEVPTSAAHASLHYQDLLYEGWWTVS